MTKERSLTSIWAIRWVLVSLTAALALVLVLRGNILIGGLLAAIAITRAVLFVRLRRRHEDLPRRFGRWSDRP